MRKCFVSLVSVWCLLTACSGGRQEGNASPAELSDETLEEADSIVRATEEMSMPMGADELFDDFFFNYATNRGQQLERTVFPLSVTDGDKVKEVKRSQWKMEPFFTKQDYYTLIFDSEEQMELVHDTAVAEATVERIDLDGGRVEQFFFSRKSGRWMLHEVRWQSLPRNANAQFLRFYQQFVCDSVFQRESLAEQIAFSGPDPDDDFSTIEGVITPDFWEAFRPDLPAHTLYNIVYGQQYPATTQKILVLRGIANGLEMTVTFHLMRGRWKLTSLFT